MQSNHLNINFGYFAPMKKPNQKPKQNNIHDSLFKSMFTIKENMQDLLQGTLPNEIVHNFKLDSLTFDPTEYVDEKLSPYFRDISCNIFYGETNTKISLLYEHKSFPSKSIHIQLLRYMLNVWEKQLANKTELTPFITMVFYHGKRKWNEDSFYQNIPEELKPFTPLFDNVLYNTNKVEDNAILKHFQNQEVQITIWFMKHGSNIIKLIPENIQLARTMLANNDQIPPEHFQKLALYLYQVADVEPEKIIEVMSTISSHTKDAFDEVRNRFIQQGVKQGIHRGETKAKEQNALRMIKKGFDDKTIAEITNLSHKRIKELREK